MRAWEGVGVTIQIHDHVRLSMKKLVKMFSPLQELHTCCYKAQHQIQFNSIQFNFINPNGNYKLLSLLRTIEQELKKNQY
jgi:hypothetical protein